jgi:hypothetical protein
LVHSLIITLTGKNDEPRPFRTCLDVQALCSSRMQLRAVSKLLGHAWRSRYFATGPEIREPEIRGASLRHRRYNAFYYELLLARRFALRIAVSCCNMIHIQLNITRTILWTLPGFLLDTSSREKGAIASAWSFLRVYSRIILDFFFICVY